MRHEGPEDMAGGLRVEIAGRLVGEEHARRVGDRPRDGDALLLAARQFGGAMVEALGEAEEIEKLAGALARFARREPTDELRHDHVLEGGELGQEVMELVDEADLLAAQARAPGIVHGGCRPAADEHLAAIRLLEQAGDMQEGRFAGAGRRHEGDDLARHDAKLRAAQDLEEAVPLRVAAFHPRQAKGRLVRRRHGGHP